MRFLAGTFFAALLLVQPVLADDIALSVTSAKAAFDPVSGQPSIEVVLTPKSAKVFGALTTVNVGNVVELRVDGELLTSPVVQSPILSGVLVITGDFTVAAAGDLAERLGQDGARIVLTPLADK